MTTATRLTGKCHAYCKGGGKQQEEIPDQLGRRESSMKKQSNTNVIGNDWVSK
jgi:hypothetical protein